MHKTTLFGLGIVAGLLFAEPAFANDMILVEDYRTDSVFVLPGEKITLDSIKLTLVEDAMVIVTFDAGVWSIPTTEKMVWLEVNGVRKTSMNMFNTFMFALSAGSYTLRVEGKSNTVYIMGVGDRLFQVLCISQETSTVMEQPDGNSNPSKGSSILASSNLVHVDGCTEIYNDLGQKVNCQITNGNIPVSTLPAGTYFVQRSDGGTTKIVKTK